MDRLEKDMKILDQDVKIKNKKVKKTLTNKQIKNNQSRKLSISNKNALKKKRS